MSISNIRLVFLYHTLDGYPCFPLFLGGWADYEAAIYLALMIATGSQNEWMETLNAETARCRTVAQHIDNASPLLVSDGRETLIAKWGGKPHRKADQLGKEFDVGPWHGQTGPRRK